MADERSSYMMIFRESSPETYEAMATEQRRECLLAWNAWCDEVAAAGRLQHGHPLEPAGRTISGPRGARVVDGPFAEAKEMVAGYLLLSDTTLDEATAIAARCPNLQHGMEIEIRPVAEGCHLARSLGWRTMREPAVDGAAEIVPLLS